MLEDVFKWELKNSAIVAFSIECENITPYLLPSCGMGSVFIISVPGWTSSIASDCSSALWLFASSARETSTAVVRIFLVILMVSTYQALETHLLSWNLLVEKSVVNV